MSTPHNSAPDDPLAGLAWPLSKAAEALHALARSAGYPIAAEAASRAEPPGPEAVGSWVEATAERAGLQADQTFGTLDELEEMLGAAAPSIVVVGSSSDRLVIAVLESRGRYTSVVAPDLTVRPVKTSKICAAVRAPFEGTAAESVEKTLARVGFGGRARERARGALLGERFRRIAFRDCWALSLPPGAPMTEEVKQSSLTRHVLALVLTQIAQYVLFLASWWMLGRSVFQGTIDRGWIAGWLLLLLSLVPLRLAATWNQGMAAASIGVWLRRRLLRGALRIDRQSIRHKGAGQWFGLVVEAASMDALALSGGIVAIFAVIELLVAALVFLAGATPLLVPLLVAWMVLTGFWGWRYLRRRRAWTTDRLGMSAQLLESMVGHRTRISQERPDRLHTGEDQLLEQYLDRSLAMDRDGTLLTALVPRGWMLVALALLTSSVVGGVTTGRLAISIGAILLVYRSLQRLAGGLSNLSGAILAAEVATPLVRAAERREATGLAVALSDRRTAEEPIVRATDLAFRYRQDGEAVLENCNLTVGQGARLLLEGPSGSGKTTLAAILTGLERQNSGLLLADGLDYDALGTRRWRARVAGAPQAHDNYILGGTLAFNLLLGRPWPPGRADLIEADAVCRELGLGDLLDRLPSGLQTIVGENGWQLSQGERTRVFLARALLQRADLLVLDESFSALDAENVERSIRTVNRRAPSLLAIAHP